MVAVQTIRQWLEVTTMLDVAANTLSLAAALTNTLLQQERNTVGVLVTHTHMVVVLMVSLWQRDLQEKVCIMSLSS